jgi:DNA-binding ferritin-like protein (Dps family)
MADGDLVYINIKEFTDNVTTNSEYEVTGTGILDALMDTATKHLTAQLGAGRLRGEDYATAYIQVYTATLQAALQAWLQKGIAEKQLELLEAQVASEESKRDLYRRQIEGFDEDYKQKILKICMDSWAVGFSVARDSFEASGIPAPMQKVTIDDLYNQFIVTELDKYNYGRPILDNP